MKSNKSNCRVLSKVLALILISTGCATRPIPPVNVADVPEFRPGYIAGYLKEEDLPDSHKLLPPPPVKGSETESMDYAVSKTALALQGNARWRIAQQDAILKFPETFNTFSCALGFQPSDAATPHLAMLIRRTTIDAGRSSNIAKEVYKRRRPFESLNQQSCTPHDEERLKKDGSYPSGHAAMGMTWALLLSEIAPKQRNAIMMRGFQFGESRIVCGAHWPSDVKAGQQVGIATYAALQNDDLFSEQLRLARREVSAQIKKPTLPATNCETEITVLKMKLIQ